MSYPIAATYAPTTATLPIVASVLVVFSTILDCFSFVYLLEIYNYKLKIEEMHK